MESQQSTQAQNNKIAGLSERMARMETKMDYVANHKDLAAVGTEVEGTRTEVARTDARITGLRVDWPDLRPARRLCFWGRVG